MVDNAAMRLFAEHAPMGILSLAAVLEVNGITAQIVDLNQLYYEYFEESDKQRQSFCQYIINKLGSQEYDVFGFSTICSTYPLTIRIAAGVKQLRPNATIMFGGPQASVVDVQTLTAFPFVDLIVRGEAEQTLPAVLENISHADYTKIPGVTFRLGGQIIRNPNAPVISDLDQLPLAAFHLYPNVERCSYLPLEIGRGCPFACSFCSTNDFFRRQFRLKSPAKAVAEMKILKQRYGVETFDLIHDMFTVNRKKVQAFCDEVIRSGEEFLWSCSARTDCVDDELIDSMARAGCKGIFFGIDSGSAQMQQVMNKGLDLAEAIRIIERADTSGMDTTVSLITGFPEETKEDLRATVSFLADSLRFDKAEPQFHLLAPLAETPITAKYQDQLHFDDIFSDISHQGWEQETEDRELIRAHRDIFPNFYAVPTPWLARTYLKELRQFILNGVKSVRWLFLAVHQNCEDLLTVFDRWQSWSRHHVTDELGPENQRTYYCGNQFPEDFLKFVRSQYRPAFGDDVLAIDELLNYEAVRNDVNLEWNTSTVPVTPKENSRMVLRSDTKLTPERRMRLLQTKVDFEDLMRRLRAKETLADLRANANTVVLRPKKDSVEVLQLSPDTTELLRFCDGHRTVSEIVEGFSSNQPVAAIPPQKVALFGLNFLCEQQLVRAI